MLADHAPDLSTAASATSIIVHPAMLWPDGQASKGGSSCCTLVFNTPATQGSRDAARVRHRADPPRRPAGQPRRAQPRGPVLRQGVAANEAVSRRTPAARPTPDSRPRHWHLECRSTRELTIRQKTFNKIIRGVHVVAERANALLKVTFKALRRVSLYPGSITRIARAALVLLQLETGRTT